MKNGVEDSYLLILFYTNGKMLAYEKHELLLIGNNKNINGIVKQQIRNFEEACDGKYRVELYNLFKFVEAEDLKK